MKLFAYLDDWAGRPELQAAEHDGLGIRDFFKELPFLKGGKVH